MEGLVAFVIVYAIVLDIGWSIIKLSILGEEGAIMTWDCHRCGAEVGAVTFMLSLWALVTHRCDDNLCS